MVIVHIHVSADKPPVGQFAPVIGLDRLEEKEASSGQYEALKCKTTPGDTTSASYTVNIHYFTGGVPAELLKFLMDFNQVCTWQGLATGPQKYTTIKWLLKGDALARFQQAETTHGTQANDHFDVCIDDLKHCKVETLHAPIDEEATWNDSSCLDWTRRRTQ